jgi:hypothetical protein
MTNRLPEVSAAPMCQPTGENDCVRARFRLDRWMVLLREEQVLAPTESSIELFTLQGRQHAGARIAKQLGVWHHRRRRTAELTGFCKPLLGK